jgi:hypothetical protein
MSTLRSLAIAMLLAVPTGPVCAQQAKTVDGVVINLGLMSAARAVHAEGHRDAHPASFPSGSRHILITLNEAKTSRPIGDAQVLVEIVDPGGAVQKKPLLHTSAGGMPDYSELFVFGSSGTYSVRVSATRLDAPKPLKTSFTIHHQL